MTTRKIIRENPDVELADVGVLVGRFQVSELHDGHRALFNYVAGRHQKLVVFLGLSPAKSTINNPLDFESRKHLIVSEYPDAIVLYIKDQHCDSVWSAMLDAQIEDVVSPGQTVALYGSRDSFISRYTGKHTCIEMQQKVFISGREERKRVSNSVKSSQEFRAGAIWATTNQWPKAVFTVDVAILNEAKNKVLLARKPTEKFYRFVGGFVQPGDTLEQSARREVYEETHLDITDPIYAGSAFVDDWRYRSEQDKITTSFFVATVLAGRPTPDDDISELRWFDLKTDKTIDLQSETLGEQHKQLAEMLTKFLNG